MTVLALASGVTVILLVDDIVWAYVFYGLVATIMGLLISREWAAFSLVNIVIIAGIATGGFSRPFSHTPIAVTISLLTTVCICFAVHQYT